MNLDNDKELSLVVSFLTMRRIIGILGISLPAVLIAGTMLIGSYDSIQNSISAYYYTNMQDVFVGVLCVVGMFLYAYTGYGLHDKLAGRLGCFFALGTAFFPTRPQIEGIVYIPTYEYIHLACAASLFLILAYFSIFLFTKTDSEHPYLTKEKVIRNTIYRVCGYTIFACILLIGLYKIIYREPLAHPLWKPVFWLESLALWAFGFSWITKGQVIWRDVKIDQETIRQNEKMATT